MACFLSSKTTSPRRMPVSKTSLAYKGIQVSQSLTAIQLQFSKFQHVQVHRLALATQFWIKESIRMPITRGIHLGSRDTHKEGSHLYLENRKIVFKDSMKTWQLILMILMHPRIRIPQPMKHSQMRIRIGVLWIARLSQNIKRSHRKSETFFQTRRLRSMREVAGMTASILGQEVLIEIRVQLDCLIKVLKTLRSHLEIFPGL